MIVITRILAALCGVALLIAAPDAARALTLDEARAAGFVRLGVAIEEPYAFVTPEGRVTGEAPEVARAVFQRLGVERVVATVVNFGDLIPGLMEGRFDVIAAGMFITPERCTRVAFTQPTFGVGQAFLVAAGNPKGLHTYADLTAQPKARLAVLAGAVEGDLARAEGVSDDQLVTVRAPADGLRAVKTGTADALALSEPSIRVLVNGQPDDPSRGKAVAMAAPFDTVAGRDVVGHGALAFRPADAALRDAVDAELAAFVGTPAHLSLVAPFGFGPSTLPEVGRRTLCAIEAE